MDFPKLMPDFDLMACDAVLLEGCFNQTVLEVHFAPFDWAVDCLAIVTNTSVVIGKTNDTYQFQEIKNVSMPKAPTCFAWSPETRVDINPSLIKFVVGNGSGNVAMYSFSDDLRLKSEVVYENSQWVDSLAFCPSQHDLLAITTAECLLVLVSTNQGHPSILHTLRLTSTGRRVSWHPQVPGHLLISESGGKLRLLNTDQFGSNGVLTVETLCRKAPIFDVDWMSDSSNGWNNDGSAVCWLAALTSLDGLNLLTLDAPCETMQSVAGFDSNQGKQVRWCPNNPSMLAVIDGRESVLKVISTRQMSVLANTEDFDNCRSFSWHLHRPQLAVVRHFKVFLVLADSH